MNIRMLRMSLWCCAVASAAAAVAAVVFATATPLARVGPEGPAVSRALSDGKALDAVSASISFDDVRGVDLRRPLDDAAIPAQAVATLEVAETNLPTLRLLGTIVEPGHSMALLADDAGKPQFHAIGDEVSGAKIVGIRDREITVQWGDKQVAIAQPVEPARSMSVVSAKLINPGVAAVAPVAYAPVSPTAASTVLASSHQPVPAIHVSNSVPGPVPSPAPLLGSSTEDGDMRALLNQKPTLEDTQ